MTVQQQQINLYQAAFRRPRIALSAAHALRLTTVLIVSLAVLSAFTHYETVALEKTAGAAAKQSQWLTQQATHYNELARQVNGVDVEQLIAELKTIRQKKQRVLENLSAQNEHKSRLFSSYFEGLARRPLDGLWFEEVSIADGGQSISLSGSTYQAELIPKLIASLQNEPAFNGVTFRQASVSQKTPESDTSLLQFSLITNVDATKGGSQ